MDKLNYLNVGCGYKYHERWVNIDMVSNSKNVIEANLLNGIPFGDNVFEVVYHSQVLEHFPKDRAKDFIKECYRVLKERGIIRIVVPNLENIVDEYKRLLLINMESPTELSEADYDWIMLEMYDQTVRNYSGGEMSLYLKQENLINEEYVINRIGLIGRSIRYSFLLNKSSSKINLKNRSTSPSFIKSLAQKGLRKIFKMFTDRTAESSEYKIGKFRLGGEIHMWMYDRYSLSRILKDCGFKDVKIMSPYKSDIPNWDVFELDVKNNIAYDPTSLFVEASK